MPKVIPHKRLLISIYKPTEAATRGDKCCNALKHRKIEEGGISSSPFRKLKFIVRKFFIFTRFRGMPILIGIYQSRIPALGRASSTSKLLWNYSLQHLATKGRIRRSEGINFVMLNESMGRGPWSSPIDIHYWKTSLTHTEAAAPCKE